MSAHSNPDASHSRAAHIGSVQGRTADSTSPKTTSSHPYRQERCVLTRASVSTTPRCRCQRRPVPSRCDRLAPPDPAEYLRHQYLYVPWRGRRDTMSIGKTLGLWVANQHSARIDGRVSAEVERGASPGAGTERDRVGTKRSRSRRRSGPRWCPTYKAMAKTYHLQQSVIVLAEWSDAAGSPDGPDCTARTTSSPERSWTRAFPTQARSCSATSSTRDTTAGMTTSHIG